MRFNLAVCIFLPSLLAASCHRSSGPIDLDGDGSPAGIDCDDSDPRRAPGFEEVFRDGVDQDCDGSDHPTMSLRQAAAGRYAGDRAGVQLGYAVACGPDRGGDGVGDLAAIASDLDEYGSYSFAAGLPRPVHGEHAIEDVLDLRVEPNEMTAFSDMLGLVDHAHGGGLFVENADYDEVRQVDQRVSFVTWSGVVDESTPTFGYTRDVAQDLQLEFWPGPYAGPADLTGDGRFDYALGPVVLEEIPKGWIDLDQAGRLALEPSGAGRAWAGAMTAVGDLNHDGQDDLLFSSGGDRVWLVFGPIGDIPAARTGPSVAQFWREEARAGETHHMDAVIGDLSGDGIDDLVIASMWNEPDLVEIGEVYVWFGPLQAGEHAAADADVRFVGELPGSRTGRALALADFDGDGTKSLVVGAPGAGGVPGLVYVFHEPLPPMELTAAAALAIYRGEQSGANAGFSLAACDTDRDGRDELVVGAPWVDPLEGAPDAGAFYWIDEVP